MLQADLDRSSPAQRKALEAPEDKKLQEIFSKVLGEQSQWIICKHFMHCMIVILTVTDYLRKRTTLVLAPDTTFHSGLFVCILLCSKICVLEVAICYTKLSDFY